MPKNTPITNDWFMLGFTSSSVQGWFLQRYGGSMITQSYTVLTKPVTNDQFYSAVKHQQPSPTEYQ